MTDLAATPEPTPDPADPSQSGAVADALANAGLDKPPASEPPPAAPPAGDAPAPAADAATSSATEPPPAEVDPNTTTRQDVAELVPPVETPDLVPRPAGVLLPTDGPHDAQEAAALRAAEAEIETVAASLDPQTTPGAPVSADPSPAASDATVPITGLDPQQTSLVVGLDAQQMSPTPPDMGQANPPGTATVPSADAGAPGPDEATSAAEGDFAGLSDEDKATFEADEDLEPKPPA